MIEQDGTVVAERGDSVWVRIEPQSGCSQCREGGGCGQRSMARLRGGQNQPVLLANTVGARVGDGVTLTVAPDALLRASLMMYCLPLAGLMAAAVLADQVLSAGDGLIVASGLGGLGLGFLFARWLSRRPATQARMEPYLVRRHPQTDNVSLT